MADYSSPYAGNFIPSLMRLGEQVSESLDLQTVYVLPPGAATRNWLSQVRASGSSVTFLDPQAPHMSKTIALAHIARQAKGVLLHSHFSAFDADVAFAATSRRLKAIWHVHSLFSRQTTRRPVIDPVRWGVVGGLMVDRIIAVSEEVARSVILRGGIASRIRIIPNGIDMSRFLLKQQQYGSELKQELGIPEAARVVLLFGWSPEVKGVDILLAAARHVSGRLRGELHYLIVCSERNRTELKAQAAGLPAVHVIDPMEDVAALYAVADCFISASRSEGFSYAVGEAMAAGLPVISSNLPSLAATYGTAGRGFKMFESERPDDLARSLENLLALSDGELQRLGDANRRFVADHYDLGRWSSEITKLYGSILRPGDVLGPSTR